MGRLAGFLVDRLHTVSHCAYPRGHAWPCDLPSPLLTVVISTLWLRTSLTWCFLFLQPGLGSSPLGSFLGRVSKRVAATSREPEVPVGARGVSDAVYSTSFLLTYRTSLLYVLATKSLALRTRSSRWLTCKMEHVGTGGKMKRVWHNEGWVGML